MLIVWVSSTIWIVVMTHDVMGSIAVFTIIKSVEPNEEQKVVVSDFGKQIAASTER